MFVFLALVFALGFVVFGVGSSGGTGIGDIIRNGGSPSNGGTSVSDARRDAERNPKDAEAQRTLARALVDDGQTDAAVSAYKQYLTLRPKDQDALRELAGLYLTQGQQAQARAQEAQALAAYRTAGSTWVAPLKLGDSGVTLGEDPINAAVNAQANETINAAVSEANAAYGKAIGTYEDLAKLSPKDPNLQLELAQTAESIQNYPRAVEAYKQFLKLAPDDTNAPIVRQRIKLLEAQLTASAPSASG